MACLTLSQTDGLLYSVRTERVTKVNHILNCSETPFNGKESDQNLGYPGENWPPFGIAVSVSVVGGAVGQVRVYTEVYIERVLHPLDPEGRSTELDFPEFLLQLHPMR